ncbi:MAG: hypothetical protein ACE5DS_00620, partial [Kiloniellaceae bacterium]
FYRIAHWLGADAAQIMRIARIETLALAFLVLGLVYAIARAIGRTRVEAALAVATTLAVSSFMERAFTVRPEMLALTLAAIGLWVVVSGPAGAARGFIAGLFAGAAFLVTQKAIYFDLALGVTLVGPGLLARRPGRALASGALLMVGWAIMLGAYVGYFAIDGAAPGAVLGRIFFGPPTENVTTGHIVYENLRYFVWQSVSRNVGAYALSLIGLGMVVIGLRRRPPGEQGAALFTVAMVALVYGVHPAPWPYNFVMAIPFLALWSPLVLAPFGGASTRLHALATLILIGTLALSFPRNMGYRAHDNALQNETARAAEGFLGAEDTYFDGVHMIPTRRHATELWLQRSAVLEIRAGARRGDTALIDQVMAQRPKVWILSYRTAGIAEALAPFLTRSYVRVAPNILLAGMALAPGGAVAFEARWGGLYRLYTAGGVPDDAEVVLDGTRRRGPMRIEPGRHALALARGGTARRYLLPADVGARAAIAEDMPEQALLFPDAHTF